VNLLDGSWVGLPIVFDGGGNVYRFAMWLYGSCGHLEDRDVDVDEDGMSSKGRA